MVGVREFDVIIIGAGAAGLMAALTAGGRGARVLLLDHMDQAGSKILISGGGRCNFTHLDTKPECFISENRHFARSALSLFTPAMFVAMVDRHGIAWHEKTKGQLFCDGSARQIVTMLLDECSNAGVVLELGQKITDITRGDGFCVSTSSARYGAPCLVVATGGLSIPKIGASSFAYDLAARFGIAMTRRAPALVPFTFADQGHDDVPRDLAGVAVDVRVSSRKVHFDDAMLFTHRGLSGPAMLQISSYWQQGEELRIDLGCGRDLAAALLDIKRARPRIELQTALSTFFPQRFASHIAQGAKLPGTIANITDAKLRDLASHLSAWIVRPTGTEGYAKAEVTRGGVDTAELSSKTMQARNVPALYFVGEAIDVTGWLGGYNFQWAWASGHAAGIAAAEHIAGQG